MHSRVHIPVLTYHSQNVFGNDYGLNDHVSLQNDLTIIAEHGLKVRPLAEVVNALFYNGNPDILDRAVCLTFDDGTLFDVADLDHPEHGRQTGMQQILARFAEQHPQLDWIPHATTFVIASPDVRKKLEQTGLAGLPWLSEDWWADAEAGEYLTIGNHSWDHRHPSAIPAEEGGGDFATVDTERACRKQIVDAGKYIAKRTGRWPELFAYPFGQASDYLKNVYFPNHGTKHKTLAAFSTEPGYLTEDANPFFLPRYICGYHWKTKRALIDILQAQGRD